MALAETQRLYRGPDKANNQQTNSRQFKLLQIRLTGQSSNMTTRERERERDDAEMQAPSVS
jgi:hypothetical protein